MPELEDTTLDEARFVPTIGDADVVFLNLAASSRAALHLLDGTRAGVVLDLHDWGGAISWHMPFPAHADAIQLSDVVPADEGRTVERLLRGRARQFAVTQSGQGAMIASGTDHVTGPSVRAAMRVANGAGDAFSAAPWHAQRAGLESSGGGRFAAAAGAFAVESDDPFPHGVTGSDVATRAYRP